MPVVPTLQQSEAVVHSLVPSGAILSYAGTAAPTGWLVCDGAPLSTTTYATLFAAIGYTFGGSGGTFNLPDLRGRFVRYDDNMGAHGVSGVTAQNAAARDSGRAHGSAQGQATAKNNLSATASSSSVSGETGEGKQIATNLVGVLGATSNSFDWPSHALARGASLSGGTQSGWYPGHTHKHNFSGTAAAQTITVSSTDAETRPINIALSAIIKI